MDWVSVGFALVILLIISVAGFPWLRDVWRRMISRPWPLAPAQFQSGDLVTGDRRVDLVVTYSYIVAKETYGGYHEERILNLYSSRRWLNDIRNGRPFFAHYSPRDPRVSVLCRPWLY